MMFISSKYLEAFSRKLQAEFSAGNGWGVYDQDMHYSESEGMQFFKDREDAKDYCRDNIDDRSELKLLAIEPLLVAVQRLIHIGKEQDNIDYYVINDTTFEVSGVKKTNPDQNPLYNPDGNEFTESLIGHFESKSAENPSDKFDPVVENFGLLRGQLNIQGFDNDYFKGLEAGMRKGVQSHEVRYYGHYGAEVVVSNHLFARNNDGFYSLEKITGILYSKVEIDHAIIAGIDTKKLETEMLDIIWEFEGTGFLKEKVPLLQQLCEDPVGRVIAVQLFNNHATPHWYDKPDFLSRAEDALKIYPRVEFPGESTSQEIYDGLKSYQLIAAEIKKYLIGYFDQDNKTVLVEKLFKGETCSLVAPSGPRYGEEVVVGWDGVSKVLSLIFKDEPKIDARKCFEKSKDVIFEDIKNKLDQFPIRQLISSDSRQRLIDNLIDGKKIPIHLEKELVPTEHIDNYFLVEVSGSRKPVVITATTFFDGAFYEMNKQGEDFRFDNTKTDSEILMIGIYRGKDLRLEVDGMPAPDTGYLVATANRFSPETDFEIKLDSIDRNKILVEQIFVQREQVSGDLVFSNKKGVPIEIDKKFWTLTDQPYWDKKQGGSEDLIPKLRSGDNKGMKL